MKSLSLVILTIFFSQASDAKKLNFQTPTPAQERDSLCEDTDELALQQIIVDAEIKAARNARIPLNLAKMERTRP